MKDAILSQTESVKVQVMNEKWDHAQAAAKQFMAAVKKSGFNLNSRLAEKDRQAAAAPKAKAKAQAAAKAAQTQATEAAAQINQEKVEKKPFFKLDSATFVVQAKMTAVTQHTAWQDGSVTSLSWPLLLKGCPFLQEWQAKPGVQLVQCSYAGTYAKDASKDPEGRTTRPLYSGQGHEEFAEFWGRVLKLFPSRPEVTGLPGPLASAVTRCWQYGYTADFNMAGPTANGLSQFKLLADGKVSWHMLNCDALVPALRTALNKGKVGLAECVKFISDLDETKIDNVMASGCRVHHCIHQRGEGRAPLCSGGVDRRGISR